MPRRLSLSWARKVLSIKHLAPSVPSNTETQVISEPTSNAQSLPYDVIDLVIREIYNYTSISWDVSTLCQCALLSRSFRSIVQPYLFSRVYIESRKRCLSFLFILLDNKDIQKYVKELYIHDKSWCDESTCPLSSSALPHILNILATHGTLHSLRFRCIDNGLVEYEQRRKPPRGSILALYGGKYQGTGRDENESDVFKPVVSFTPQATAKPVSVSSTRGRKAIEHLFDSVYSPSKIDEFATLAIQRKADRPLKSLGLGGLESTNVLEFLQGPYCTLDLTNLSQLTVYSVDPCTLAAVCRVIKHSGPSLERMMVYQPTRLDYWLTELLPERSLNLSALTRLRDFAFFLRQPDHHGKNFLAWAAGNRFQERLESISVIMTAAFTQCLFKADGRDFKHLDGSLLRMVKDQIGACEVYIYVVEETHRVTERMVRDALPRIDVTGMLKVRILRTQGANYLPSVDFTVYVST